MVQRARKINKHLGVRKIYDKLNDDIHQIDQGMGRDKLFGLLRTRGLLIRRRRKFVCTTQSKHRFRKFDNKMKDFQPTAPNQAWAADITYLRTRHGFVYLFLLTDFYSRKIVGWALRNSLGIEGAQATVRMAMRQCKDLRGVIHHSDRGIQYCAPAFVDLLCLKGMQISMGEAGNCYDNALAERVNGILKQEYALDATFKNFKQTMQSTREAIKDYNEERPHWSLKFKVPAYVHQFP